MPGKNVRYGATENACGEIDVKKITIRTSVAFIIWAVLIVGGFVYVGFKPEAGPYYSAFAMWLTAGLVSYTGKRLLQKRKEFNNKQE